MLGAYLTDLSQGQLSLLEKIVPSDQFYHRLAKVVDLEFVRALVAPYYSHFGRPSLDPVVFFKLLLVTHFENITSDRKLIQTANLHLGIRYFLGYDLEQPFPCHSTISRTRQRIPSSVFEQCFSKVLDLCIKSRLVAGHTQALDSAYVKANASIHNRQPKHSSWLTLTADTVEANEAEKKTRISASAGRLKHIHRYHSLIQQTAPKKAGKLLSNLTHYSPTDADARISIKTGKQRMLSYMLSLGVDTVDVLRHPFNM